jgi:(1->4)-alpha-D-glucan 1-alpha-D-glucosylmutase
VDWARRRALLTGLRAPADADERKLFLIRELLALRARRPEAFAGGYTPLDVGPNAVAFLRGHEVAVALPIRDGGLDPSRLELASGTWRPAFDPDVLSGAQISVLERT